MGDSGSFVGIKQKLYIPVLLDMIQNRVITIIITLISKK